MRPLLVAVALGLTVLAGCLGGPTAPAATGTTATPAPTAQRTETASFAYELRPGPIDDDIAHVYLDLAVYVAEHPDDVVPCTDGAPLLDSRWDPTATPVRTPTGACRAFDAGRTDLVALNGSTTIGPYTVGSGLAGGHSLVVHDVTVVLANGSTARDIHDIDFRAVHEESRPMGTYGVVIGVVDYHDTEDDRPWRFGVEVERYDPAGD